MYISDNKKFMKEISINIQTIREYMPKISKYELTGVISTFVHSTKEIPLDEKEKAIKQILNISDSIK